MDINDLIEEFNSLNLKLKKEHITLKPKCNFKYRLFDPIKVKQKKIVFQAKRRKVECSEIE